MTTQPDSKFKIQNSKFGNARLNVMLMADVTGRGGAEKALVDLALRLDRDRFNVSVCATRSEGNYQPLLDAAGVPTFVLGRQTRRDIRKLGGLVPLLRRQQVHILHTHLFGSNTWGRLLGKLAGVPIIIAHEHWSSKPRHEVLIDRLLYRLSDRILVASKASKEVVMQVEKIPPRHITVVYNGVDTGEFAPLLPGLRTEDGGRRGEACLAPTAPEPTGSLLSPPSSVLSPRSTTGLVVGTLGRLTPDKGGQDDLVRAVASLAGKGRPISLLVVGDGPLRPDLERLSTELGLSVVSGQWSVASALAPEPANPLLATAVGSHSPLATGQAIFTGTRSGPDVARLLGCMDVFVLPSHREALPIALLEAMSVGLPVIATRVGGIPEIIEDGVTGLLVPAGQPAALEATIERLADDSDLSRKLGQAARAHIQAHFTLEQTTRRVEQIYEQIARKKGLR